MILLKKKLKKKKRFKLNWLILFCLLTIVPTYSISQNISKITITNEQLRTANIIFAEHSSYSKQIPLFKSQIYNLEKINDSWERTDSIRKVQILNYYNIVQNQNRSIESLNKSLKRNKKIIGYGAVSIAALLIMCIAIK